MTIKTHIDTAIEKIERHAARGSRSAADRELALAITHLEDAKMRVTRGIAMYRGIFNEVDLQTTAGIERATSSFEANVAGNAPGGVARS